MPRGDVVRVLTGRVRGGPNAGRRAIVELVRSRMNSKRFALKVQVYRGTVGNGAAVLAARGLFRGTRDEMMAALGECRVALARTFEART